MNNSFNNNHSEDIDVESRNETFGANNSVIISNLPYTMKSLDIQEFCQSVGEILEVRLSTHVNSNRSKGWA